MQPVIVTRCGYFDFRSPDEYEFEIDVIGRALSKLCRFTGHTMQFYSVAQHSVFVSMLLEAEGPELAMMGLLHDAAEAFVGDVAAPLKMLLPEYKMIEQRVERAICRAFGLPEVMPELVKDADLVALATEQRDLIPRVPGDRVKWHWQEDGRRETPATRSGKALGQSGSFSTHLH
jgi:hypothetical protein